MTAKELIDELSLIAPDDEIGVMNTVNRTRAAIVGIETMNGGVYLRIKWDKAKDRRAATRAAATGEELERMTASRDRYRELYYAERNKPPREVVVEKKVKKVKIKVVKVPRKKKAPNKMIRRTNIITQEQLDKL